ncbi:MAG: carbohydrate-binding family 9-like protein [Spirochaetota bacterium]
MQYTIKKTDIVPTGNGDWVGIPWLSADIAAVSYFHPESTSHRPATFVKVLYDKKAIFVLFRVIDRYVKSIHTHYQDPVCRDSCVEFFIQPKPEKGYFNFEINCGGTMLLYYIEDHIRTPDGFKKYTPVAKDIADTVKIFPSLPPVVQPEITAPVEWYLEYSIPFALFEYFVGGIEELDGRKLRGNFFKCGDETSHPHWASWSPIGGELNFHRPDFFGTLFFSG